MSKINTDNLDPKPIERDNKIKTPKELKPVGNGSKPLVTLNLNDKINQLLLWLRSALMDATKEIISGVIPTWFYILLILMIGLIVVLNI